MGAFGPGPASRAGPSDRGPSWRKGHSAVARRARGEGRAGGDNARAVAHPGLEAGLGRWLLGRRRVRYSRGPPRPGWRLVGLERGQGRPGSGRRRPCRDRLARGLRAVDSLAVGTEGRAAGVAEPRRQEHGTSAGRADDPWRAAGGDRGPALAAEEVSLAVLALARRAFETGGRGVGDHLGAGVRHVVAEQEARRPDRHQVAVSQVPLTHPVPVHHGAVRGVAVTDVVLAATVFDHRVPPRDHGIGQNEVVRRIAADGDQVAVERDLPPGRGRRVENQLRHRGRASSRRERSDGKACGP